MNINGVLILIIAILILVIIGLLFWRDDSGKTNDDNVPSTSEDNLEKWQEGIISHNGKSYIYNQKINAYLMMGIDKSGKVETAADYQSGGQSDAMFLVVTNAADKTISVISINRNTMTRVETFYKDGISSGYEIGQICVQHGFGDGKKLSCTRAADAVSHLFYNLPITGYLSLRLDAIPLMNDAIGGVKVEVLEDIEYPSKGVSLKKGEIKKLTGEEAYCYLRGRELDEFDSATNRLRRQEQYIGAFSEALKGYTQGSASEMLSIYESIEDYIVTNIDFADLADELSKYEYDDSHMYTVPGETKMGEEFEEYYVDEDKFFDLIIDIFYQEVKK